MTERPSMIAVQAIEEQQQKQVRRDYRESSTASICRLQERDCEASSLSLSPSASHSASSH